MRHEPESDAFARFTYWLGTAVALVSVAIVMLIWPGSVGPLDTALAAALALATAFIGARAWARANR